MNPYTTSKDPRWHRVIDALVILAIGFTIGVFVTGTLMTYETTTTRTIRRTPALQLPTEDTGGTVDAPQNSVNIEEI